MGSIYSKARRVIIWLSEATYDTDYVMHYIEQLEKEGAKYATNDQKISDTQWVNIWSEVVHSLSADQRDLLVEGLRSLLRRNWLKSDAAVMGCREWARGGSEAAAGERR
jgi:hypothetical protein